MGNQQQGSSKSRGYDALSTSGSDGNDQALSDEQHQARLKALEASSRPHKTRNAEEQKKKRWEIYDNLGKKAAESTPAPSTYGSGKPVVTSSSSSSSSSSFASSSGSRLASSSHSQTRNAPTRAIQEEAREKRVANIQNRLDSKSTRHVAKNNREKQWEAYKSFDAPERSSVPRLKTSIASGDNLLSSSSSASPSAPSAPYAEEVKQLPTIPGTQGLHSAGAVTGQQSLHGSASGAGAGVGVGAAQPSLHGVPEEASGRFVDRQTLDTASDLEVALVGIAEYSPATIQLLRRILQNLVTAPAGEAGMKYRKVKLDSEKLQQLVVRVEGALAAFMMIGFEKVTLPSPSSGVLEDYLYFPPSQSMELARLVLSRLPAPEK